MTQLSAKHTFQVIDPRSFIFTTTFDL